MTFKISFVSKFWVSVFVSVFCVLAESLLRVDFSLYRAHMSQNIESVFKWNVLTEKTLNFIFKLLLLKIGYKQNKDTEVNWKIFILLFISP